MRVEGCQLLSLRKGVVEVIEVCIYWKLIFVQGFEEEIDFKNFEFGICKIRVIFLVYKGGFEQDVVICGKEIQVQILQLFCFLFFQNLLVLKVCVRKKRRFFYFYFQFGCHILLLSICIKYVDCQVLDYFFLVFYDVGLAGLKVVV